jgi:phosphomannomutase
VYNDRTHMEMIRHIFFDMDNTLTRSRGGIEPKMETALAKLASSRDVVVVSGAVRAQVLKQLGKAFEDKVLILAQNGNFATERSGAELWFHKLPESGKLEVLRHIAAIKESGILAGLPVSEADTVEDREAQISYSIIGHNAKREDKEAFDPHHERRSELLAKFPFQSDAMEVVIGGTTCLDYIEKGRTKGANVAKLIGIRNWDKSECLYVGDALFPGGNDSSVSGICPTHQVENPDDTLRLIERILGI